MITKPLLITIWRHLNFTRKDHKYFFKFSDVQLISAHKHWRRLVKILGARANQNIGGKVVKSDKCMGISQLVGARARANPPNLRQCTQVYAYQS